MRRIICLSSSCLDTKIYNNGTYNSKEYARYPLNSLWTCDSRMVLSSGFALRKMLYKCVLSSVPDLNSPRTAVFPHNTLCVLWDISSELIF